LALTFESLKYFAGYFDEFDNEFLPYCTVRPSLGKYAVIVTSYSMILLELTPIVVYGVSYVKLYLEFRKTAAASQGMNLNLLEIKKRLHDKVKVILWSEFFLLSSLLSSLLTLIIIKYPIIGKQIVAVCGHLAFLYADFGFDSELYFPERPLQRGSGGSVL